MEWVETTGRTVAEALDAALDQLGVDEQEAEVQVLQEPQKGLFGRLRAEARVRARVRPARPRPKTERRDRRRRGDREGRPRRGNGRSSAVASGGRNAEARVSGNGSGKGGDAARGSSSSKESKESKQQHRVVQEAGKQGGAAGTDGGGGRKRRRRGGRGRAKKEGAAVTNESSSEATTQIAAKVADLEAQRDAVDEFLRGLLGAFGRPEASVSVRTVEEDTVEAEVNGEELGLLVGPKGQTLQAVHELVRSMVQRRFVGEAHARVRVDVAGYRQRRREALERFTRSMVSQVQETGRPVVLDPMGASDRKTVHDVVNDIEGVKTISEGEEPARRVIIQPN